MAAPPPDDPPAVAFDRVTAYHEAGHAVVALCLERPVHRVSVLPNQDLLGKCEFRKGVFRPTDDWLETEILIALAGMVAEARLTGTYDRLAASRDLAYVRKLSLQRATERQLERFERRMLAKAENLLADDALWAAVEAIAEQLVKLGTISGRATRHLYDRATKES
jgi:ATP-dependent Zn protease